MLITQILNESLRGKLIKVDDLEIYQASALKAATDKIIRINSVDIGEFDSLAISGTVESNDSDKGKKCVYTTSVVCKLNFVDNVINDLSTKFRMIGLTHDQCYETTEEITKSLSEIEKEWVTDRDKSEFDNITVFQYIKSKLGI